MSKKDRQKEGKKELMEGEGLKGLEKKTQLKLASSPWSWQDLWSHKMRG